MWDGMPFEQGCTTLGDLFYGGHEESPRISLRIAVVSKKMLTMVK
jgi:hypothetical protein